jgi:hypothetical protein
MRWYWVNYTSNIQNYFPSPWAHWAEWFGEKGVSSHERVWTELQPRPRQEQPPQPELRVFGAYVSNTTKEKMILESLGWNTTTKMRFVWKMNYLRAWRCHFGEVGVSIRCTLSTRWSGNIFLRSRWEWGMLLRYKNIRVYGRRTLCARGARGLARSKDEHVQKEWIIAD